MVCLSSIAPLPVLRKAKKGNDMKRTKFAGKIGVNAKHANCEYRQSGRFFENNVVFDHNLMLPDHLKYFVTDLLTEIFTGRKHREEVKINAEILLANLICNQKKRTISVSLNSDKWKISETRQTSYAIIEIIKAMNEQGYLKMVKGYKFERSSRNTRIWATNKLLEFCPIYPDAVVFKPKSCIRLRDDKGNEIDWKHTPKTLRIEAILRRINSVNHRADILFDGQKITAYLMAIYKRNWNLYGRLHTRGYRHIQSMPEIDRAEITINGEPVCELDYSALHPNLLYATEGIQFKGDPYTIIDDRPEARPFLKRILLSLLNSKDETQALRAANYIFFQDREEKKRLNKIGITTAKPFIQLFKVAHKPISHYFCTGKETGMRIMNKDARIALDICHYFAKQDIPILAIHDSFIVQQKHRDELEEIMQHKYMKHTGGFTIKIK